MIVEIAIGSSFYKIRCEEDEKENILKCAAKLNQRVNSLAMEFGNNVRDEKNLLVIAALMMEDEIDQMQNVVLNDKSDNHEDDHEDGRINEQDVYDAVSENMENVANYVENLITKIKNY